jgi:hypothetical protein
MNDNVLQVIFQFILRNLARLTLGTSATDSCLAGEGKIKFKKFFRNVSRIRMLNTLCRENNAELTLLFDTCLKHTLPVTSPFALISQIQRSGGTLLSQLFDGHPEIHAHPHELKIGYPKKYEWPKIDLDDSRERWFTILFEKSVLKHFREGYKKDQRSNESFPFLLLPSLQKKIFLNYFNALERITMRDVFDAYMTSYFGAWLDDRNRNGEKKFVTAFTPRLMMEKENARSFFEVYPDGRLISIIRDPINWYPSAFRHNEMIKKPKYADVDSALSQWKESAEAALWNKHTFGDRVCMIRFEDLVVKTETVMRHLAGFLDIQFDPILLIPTFNKSPIRANTSFKLQKPMIMDGTLSRYKTLGEEKIDTVRALTKDEYQRVLDEVTVF